MTRTEARAAAMKMIYEWDMGGDGGEDTMKGLLEISPEEKYCEYAMDLVKGVSEHAPELDERISRYAVDWKIERFTKVDLAILRLATYELRVKDAPGGVVVSEAVELSRAYSTDKSASFINGVLGNMLRDEAKA